MATSTYERLLKEYQAYAERAKAEAATASEKAQRERDAELAKRKANMELASMLLRYELRPMWNDVGEAATLAAAAEDADEWMALIECLHARGVWKFSDGESLQKLRACRESLRARLRHNAELCGGTSATNAVLNGKT